MSLSGYSLIYQVEISLKDSQKQFMGVVYNSFMNTRVLLRIWDDLLILAIYKMDYQHFWNI